MKELPRIAFAQLPTPIEYLPRLSSVLGGHKIYVKRDDQTGLAFGGNKTRKLEFLVADAQAQGARTLITAGAIQSNHCRQTAAAAAKFGFACVLVLTTPSQEKAISNQERLSGNLFLDKLFGAEIFWSERLNREKEIEKIYNKLFQEGKKPYIIPYGGSNTLGASAYMLAVKELVEQLKSSEALESQPDWIVIPSSSGGTQAGMVLGAMIFGYYGRILGISVDERADILKDRVARLANQTARLHEEQANIIVEDILVNDEFLGEGYGIPGESEIEAISIFAKNEGLLLDPVYTSRAAGGLISLIRNDFFKSKGGEETSILFWHTGGTPALFVDQYLDLFKDAVPHYTRRL
jgi:D-cysteine desulfhydrase family pyridoxal phosphate-dependent enzyme